MTAFSRLVERERASWAVIDGSGFHRYDREAFQRAVGEAAEQGLSLSHFHPDANLVDRLEQLLGKYASEGRGETRGYVHTLEQAEKWGSPPGTFTPWMPLPEEVDLLFYKGLHGCLVTEESDLASYMDLKIGVVPVVNLEWVRKIHRDTDTRGYSHEAVKEMILRRLPDYVRYITPQFSRTDINFQRVPVVDTSNPFVARDLPADNESVIVIRVAHIETFPVDFPALINKIDGSQMSRRNSIVVPGDQMGYAMELIFAPILHEMLERKRQAIV